jgi:hypothetical protein
MNAEVFHVSIPAWVEHTTKDMARVDSDSRETWNRFCHDAYTHIAKKDCTVATKPCPRAAAYALWYLGMLRFGNRPLLRWPLVEIRERLGKNAAYAAIAADLLYENELRTVAALWKNVQQIYRRELREEPAASEQGEIKLVVALYKRGDLIVYRA